MITYQRETVTEVKNDIQPLLQAHYDEIATHKEVKVLDPDWTAYELMCDAELIRIVTARDDGELIGYCATFVHRHLHYDMRCALNDVFYLKPEHRGGLLAYRLLRYAIADLQANGVQHLIMHMKVAYPFRELLTKFGMVCTEENWEITF